jgi:hypothetical protein
VLTLSDPSTRRRILGNTASSHSVTLTLQLVPADATGQPQTGFVQAQATVTLLYTGPGTYSISTDSLVFNPSGFQDIALLISAASADGSGFVPALAFAAVPDGGTATLTTWQKQSDGTWAQAAANLNALVSLFGGATGKKPSHSVVPTPSITPSISFSHSPTVSISVSASLTVTPSIGASDSSTPTGSKSL